MWHDVKNIFHFIIIFQCVFLSIYILSHKKERQCSNLFLVAFLLIIAVTQIGGVLEHFEKLRQLVSSSFPHLFHLDFSFRYLYVPMLFLYILSITDKDFRLERAHLWHFAPFLLVTIVILVRFHLHDPDTLRAILRTDSLFRPLVRWIFNFLEYGQFFVYAAVSIIFLRRYRIKIKDVFSSINQIDLSWLNFVIFGFITWKILRLLDLSIYLAIGAHPIVIILYITAEIAFLVFVSLMFFKGLRQPVIFSGIEANNFRRKYEKTSLDEKVREDYKNKLLAYMESEKPYLDSTLSLPDLAQKISIPAHHLSQVLNNCLNKNFFDFINTYRVMESKRLLAKPGSEKTILEILYESGFNSKSVFNAAFKKESGMTPSMFRRQQNSKTPGSSE